MKILTAQEEKDKSTPGKKPMDYSMEVTKAAKGNSTRNGKVNPVNSYTDTLIAATLFGNKP